VLEDSLVHWATFVLFGCVAAALLAAADRDPGLLAGSLFVRCCCFEVAALALIAILGEWLFEALPQWSIVIGNLLAVTAMFGVFFRRHRIAWLEFPVGRRVAGLRSTNYGSPTPSPASAAARRKASRCSPMT